jgi:hypothetical protein
MLCFLLYHSIYYLKVKLILLFGLQVTWWDDLLFLFLKKSKTLMLQKVVISLQPFFDVFKKNIKSNAKVNLNPSLN